MVNLNTSTNVFRFNSPLSLTCSYTSVLPVSNVQWFINGRPVMGSPGVLTSTLTVDSLEEEGFYQCFVRTENGNIGSVNQMVSALGE